MASPERNRKRHDTAFTLFKRKNPHSLRRSDHDQTSTPPPPYEFTSINQVAEDAKALRDAMGIFHTDKAPLIRIVPTASAHPHHMALLKENYKRLFNCDLESDISRYTSSEFKHAMLGLIKGPVRLDVDRLHSHIALPPITTQHIFTEIILSRSSARLKEIQEMYDQMHRKSLVDSIRSLCPGRTGQFLAMYLETARPEDGVDARDIERIQADVRYLHEGIWLNGKNMDQVSAIFARSSQERLSAIIDEFEARYLVSLKEFVGSKIEGDYQETLLALLSWADDPMKLTRDFLIKLWPIHKNRLGRDTWTITHTLLWGHFNRTLFRVGKMRLRYSGYFLRDELERGLFDDPYRKLMLRICDAKY